MPCTWRPSDLQLLLILTVFLVAECLSAGEERPVTVSNSAHQVGKDNYSSALPADRRQNCSNSSAEVNTSRSVLVDTKAELSCCPIPLTTVIMITWKIIFRDKPTCTGSYRADSKEMKELNCTDRRITWAFPPDQTSTLQIDPVAITHDGYYRCEMVTPDGNYDRGYHLQVLVAPEVTLLGSENRTAVCKAAAGKPAAWISWTPEGDCVSEQEHWDNSTVTVQSTCHWADSNVSTVSCSVSHGTGNTSLSIELSQGAQTPESIRILYIIHPIFIILVIVGSIWILKTNGCRKCKFKKAEDTPDEEEELQPYASYTEKSNPLYDTTNNVKTSQELQREVDGTNLHAV